MSRHRLLGGLTASAIAVSGLAAMSVAPAHAVATTIKTTVAGNGWVANSQGPATGGITDGIAPDGRDAARFTTNGDGNVMTLFGTSYIGTRLNEVSELSYDTYVEHSNQDILAPSLGMEIWSADGGDANTTDDFHGTLVFEPYVQTTQEVAQDTWQSWDAMAPDALWWSSRDVFAPDGSVLYPRQSVHTLAEFKAAFAANPAKYPGDIHTNNGIKAYVGSTAAQAGWDGFIGYVDGIRLATDGTVLIQDKLWDFTQGLGPCVAAVDQASKTYTLTEDCDTFETITVPDGWTLDGGRHVIIAREDTARPNFPGPIVTSATGGSSAPAEMHVKDLFITTDFSGQNSGGTLAGVKFDRAGGSVTDVTIDGVTHGNGVQEGHGLWVRNRDSSGGTAVPRASIVVDGLDVTRYQKSGVIFDGNLTFAMTDSFVGHSADRSGAPIFNIAANSVQISRTAHGSLTDSEIELNEYDDQAGDGSEATGVLLYNAKTVEVARNLITGFDADVAVYAFNTTFDVDTELTLSCNLISREVSQGDYDPHGIGLYADEQPNIVVRALDNTFLGWKQDVTGVANLSGQGECLPGAATSVALSGGRNATDVTWEHGDDLEFAPRTGYTVTISGGSFTRTKLVDADETSTTFRGIPARRDFTVTVAAENVSGMTDTAATLHHTGLTIDQADRRIVFGQRTTIEGVLRSSDPSADLAGRTLVLEARAVAGGAWEDVDRTDAAADGSYAFTVRPGENTRYRVRYDGQPDLGVVSGPRNVYVAAHMAFRVDDTTVRRGSTVLFYGGVTPDHDGDRILLQRLVNGKWQTVQRGHLSGRSTFVFKWEPHTTRDFVWQVAMYGDADHVAGSSRNILVKVR